MVSFIYITIIIHEVLNGVADGGFHLRGYPRQFFSTDVGHSIGVGPATVEVKSSHVDDPQSVGLNVIESGWSR